MYRQPYRNIFCSVNKKHPLRSIFSLQHQCLSNYQFHSLYVFFLLASKLQNFAYKKSLPDIHEKWPSQHNRQKAKQIETWKFRLLWGWIVMRFSCDRKGIHMMALVASVQCLYGYSHAWLEFYCKHNQMCGLIRLLAGCMRNERMTWTVMPWLMMPHISRCNQYGGKEKSRK